MLKFIPKLLAGGSGRPMREFPYVDDMAEASLFVHDLDQSVFLKNTCPMLSHINVGTGTDMTIKELSETTKGIVGFFGELMFDKTKQDGTSKKLMDVSLLANLGRNAEYL